MSRSSRIFFSRTQQKKTATQITPTATQFNFRVAETAMQNFDSKFIPAQLEEVLTSPTRPEVIWQQLDVGQSAQYIISVD